MSFIPLYLLVHRFKCLSYMISAFECDPMKPNGQNTNYDVKMLECKRLCLDTRGREMIVLMFP